MAWATWMLTLSFLGAALSGCVAARDPPREPSPPVCESYTVSVERECCAHCGCDDCGSCWGAWCRGRPPEPPGVTPVPACPAYNVTYSSFTPTATYPDGVLTCAVPEPPLFEPFREIAVRACASCVEVALRTGGERAFLATVEGLDVLGPATRLFVPAPVPAPGASYTFRSPTVATDGIDAWYGAIATASLPAAGADFLVVARWDGGGGWLSSTLVGLDVLRGPTAVDRVQLAMARGGVVALLEAQGLAWSIPVGVEPPRPELLSPPDARVRLGAPAQDAEGRAFVPYVLQGHAAVVAPSLGYATTPDAGSAWSRHDVPTDGLGPAQGTRPAVDARGGAIGVTWIAASGTLLRTTSGDGGAGWSGALSWRHDAAATSSPATAHDGLRATLAWAEEERVVLARGEHGPRGWLVMEAPSGGAPAIDLIGARAAVAWLSPERGLVLALEGGPDACGAAARCPAFAQ